jgi:hypothetical protein
MTKIDVAEEDMVETRILKVHTQELVNKVKSDSEILSAG